MGKIKTGGGRIDAEEGREFRQRDLIREESGEKQGHDKQHRKKKWTERKEVRENFH